MVCLIHIDAKLKRQRFYIVSVTRTLFGEWSVQRDGGGETVRDIARTYNVSYSTISRLRA